LRRKKKTVKKILPLFSELIKYPEDEIASALAVSEDKMDCRIYPRSIHRAGDCLVMIAATDTEKFILGVSEKKNGMIAKFAGESFSGNGIYARKSPFSEENAIQLRKFFQWTAPISLRKRKTTIGCGDRLGRATPGHISAIRKFEVSPVLAQQSMRELSLTGRTYANVVDDVSFLVFQEGFKDGFGGDGDHLKKIEDINSAIDAGMTMITLDLSDLMKPDAANWSRAQIEEAFAALPLQVSERIKETYFDRVVHAGTFSFTVSPLDAKRCALIFVEAMDFAGEVSRHLRRRRGDEFDLEISIDETICPTLPHDHFFIVNELAARNVDFVSIAPRFIGEFQKGIDYIGDLKSFREQFAKHCEIARAFGNYKISVHSGSDKFAVFPSVGEFTNGKFHLKTAGTSWLEAVNVIAIKNPALYRKIHQKALDSFVGAKKLYHVTTDISKIKNLNLSDDEGLPDYLDKNESRQLLHITYGSILAEPGIRDEFFAELHKNEKLYIEKLDEHFTRHLSELGIQRKKE
jgi:hypothetical protein